MILNREQADEVEVLTRKYGLAILAHLQNQQVVPFGPRWWDDRLMEWIMNDEAVKLQLFRFIDVLPMLHSEESINRHLREYFNEAGPHLPPWARLPLRWLPQNGWAGRILARTARHNAERLARRFIAGNDLQDTLLAITNLRQQSATFTVDLLGEATVTEVEAEKYRADYLQLLEGLCAEVNAWPPNDLIDRDPFGPLPRVNLSIKLSSLYSQFDPIDPEGTCQVVCDRLRPILRLAKYYGAFINFDMEQYSFKDVTLLIFRTILEENEFCEWPDVGIAIQAYLVDTARDLEVLAKWVDQRGTPIGIRLIKGAYWDYECVLAAQHGWPVPVYTQKWETDANYERLTRFLLDRHTQLRPAFGSHNVRSLAHALAYAEMLRLPPRCLELQMLYGMVEPLQNALVALGQRVRIYTPVGQLLPGMAYFVRRLLENTANESFLRASLTEHQPEETLLINPLRANLALSHCESRSDGDAASTSPSFKPEPTAAALTMNQAGIENGGSRMQDRNVALSLRETKAADLPAASRLTADAPPFRNEPVGDFSREDERQKLRLALEEVGKQLGKKYPLVINNRPVDTEKTLDSVNPSHRRQIVGRCASAMPAHAEQAIAAAKKAFPAWRTTPATVRADFLNRAAEVMRRRRFELAAWMIYECGKQWREADADIAEAIDFCAYYAREMLRLAVPLRRDIAGEENEYFYEPRGVTAVIAPWNFPLAILCGMTVAALVTGNTVIMKPAEQSAVLGAKLMEVFLEIGLPPGVVACLSGAGEEIGPVLTQHPDVAMIVFTGSKEVGLLINRQAAATPHGQDHVKRVVAEMGGKNAIIVDEDADLDEAVRGVAASAFGYQGEKCSACSRVIVLEAIYDQFVTRLVEATRSLKVGPAEDPGTSVGPVIDADALQRIQSFIEKGKTECHLQYAADIGFLADEGFYVGPHIFTNVAPSAVIAQEEIFGPVLAAIRARDLEHALEIANGTPYALTGGLYSRSPENIARIKRELNVGNLYINRKITGALVDRQPFGGFRLSGIGSKAGGPDYLLQFLQPRTITENTMRRGFAPEAKM
jgi:RHH-type proline utilization regulon transcriptional repressor/proline dehydrogenase/delta 1-pyrroline-5-carboxylate dehydrogenase